MVCCVLSVDVLVLNHRSNVVASSQPSARLWTCAECHHEVRDLPDHFETAHPTDPNYVPPLPAPPALRGRPPRHPERRLQPVDDVAREVEVATDLLVLSLEHGGLKGYLDHGLWWTSIQAVLDFTRRNTRQRESKRVTIPTADRPVA